MSGSVKEVRVSLPTLHPGQQRIADHPARHKMVRCGRRFGKTMTGIVEAAKVALGGGNVGWFAPSNKYALDAWRELVRRLRPVAELPGGRISEQEKRMELPEMAGGGMIEVWSLDGNDDPARGRKYDLVVIDEAGLVGKLSVLWEAAIEPTLLDRIGRSLFLGTPKGARTPFNVMFAEAEADEEGQWAAFHGKTAENVMVKGLPEEVEKLRQRAERRGTLALWRQEYEGIPADDGSNPIGLDAIRAAVAPLSGEPVAAWGVDLAKAVDFTVAIGVDAWGRCTRVERFQSDWGATKKRLRALIGTETPVVMDATGVGSPIVADLQALGMQVDPFVFSRKSRGLLIEELISAIHEKQLTVPAGFVQGELESLGVDYNSETGFTRYEVPDGMHDDGIMALAMAWRCYQYHAENPQWPVERIETEWTPDVDTALGVDSPDEFAVLGGGW